MVLTLAELRQWLVLKDLMTFDEISRVSQVLEGELEKEKKGLIFQSDSDLSPSEDSKDTQFSSCAAELAGLHV